MNTKKKTIKTIVGGSLACSALLLSGAGIACLKQPVLPVYAYGVPNIGAGLTNPNFDQSTSSTQPFSPTGYTAYSDGVKVENGSNIESNVEAGVINLTNEKYQTKFANAIPSRPDNYVLMIDSTTENDAHSVNYGYRTTSAIKMDANSKYILSVDVFTATDDGIACIYLYNKDGEVVSSFKGINAYNDWRTYTFFVQTGSIDAEEYYLGMSLEGKGIVLFDNLGGNKVSGSEFATQKEVLDDKIEKDGITTDIYKTINNVDNVLNTYIISSTCALYDTKNSTSTNFKDTEYANFSQRTLVKDSDGENTHAIKVQNSEKSYGIFETEQEFTFEQNRIYQVSINVKTKNLNGQATLELFRTDDDETEHNKTITITSNTVSSENKSVTNDYKTYSFVIHGASNKDVTYKLIAGLGDAENLTSGEMYISQIQISKIDYNTFTNTSGDNTASINFVKTYDGSSIMLNNGDFNGFEIKDHNAPFPATPTSWTVTTGTNSQIYGVVNTKTFNEDLNGLNLSNLSNPSSDNNNILMMYNSQNDTLSYTSASKSLTADSYHKFEIDVKSQNASIVVSLVADIDDSEITLCSKTISATASWKTVAMYLHTGNQDLSVSLKLTLKSTNGYAYGFADNAKFDYLTAPTEDDFNQLISLENQGILSDNLAVADLNNLLASNSNNNFETPYYFSKGNGDGVLAGTITLGTSNLLNTVISGQNNLDLFNSIKEEGIDKKVLSIWSTENVAYTLTSKLGYTLTTGEGNTYYKLTVKVFTQNIGTNNSDADESKIGAGISLSGFDTSFSGIKSENSWTAYTFYIKAEKDTTTKLELALGNEENLAKGAVFFGDISFETITESAYSNAKENETTKVLIAKTESASDNSTETEETEDEKESSDVNWWYLVPGLLTALAILIAIVGFLIRKIKWRKPRKKSKNEYDRNKTVSMQYYTRKATTLREEKVRELTQDLEKINAQRKQFEDDYKQELTRLREMKIKRVNPAEITKLEKELKKNQKMSASLGVTANRISEDLKYTKTDAYLNSLIRKLSREKSEEENSTNAE